MLPFVQLILMARLLAFVLLAFAWAPLQAEELVLTTATTITGDTDGVAALPSFGNGRDPLLLEFTTGDGIPPGAFLTGLTLRVAGIAGSNSARSEISLTLVRPEGGSETWDLGDDLAFPQSSGDFDTGILSSSSPSGSAAGLYRVEVRDSQNDSGNDYRIDSVTLTLSYSLSPPIPDTTIAAFLNGALPSSDPAIGGIEPPATLTETGAFRDLANLIPASGLLSYQVNSPLWSDGARKKRWIAIPDVGPGTANNSNAAKVVFRVDEPWTFPRGTVAVKHFELPLDTSPDGAARRLETRFLVSLGGGDFYGVTYRWRADGSEADLLSDGASEQISVLGPNGVLLTQTWDYPSRSDCRSCHNISAGVYLGVNTWQLNRENAAPDGEGLRNQIEAWAERGIFANAPPATETLPKAVAIDDMMASLEQRMRSYLASNCANCHNPANNLNTSFDLRLATPLSETGMIQGPLLYDLGVPGAAVIVPQDLTRSILLRRMDTVDIHRMPPIGRNQIDQAAVNTLKQWIMTLPVDSSSSSNPPFANDDDALTRDGTAITLNVLGNDLDSDGDSFEILQVSTPNHGTVSWTASGDVTYQPQPGFTGRDEFTYQLRDLTGATSQAATVRIVVAPAATASTASFRDQSALLPNPTHASGVAMAVVDMNQDGRDDIIHFDRALDLVIDYQNANGTFTQRSLGRANEQRQWGLAIGDTDNNGFPDLITGGFFDGLHYLRANANGSGYARQTLTNPSIYLQAVNFVDIDNDGWLDLFPCHDLGSNPPFRNDGTGVLTHDPSLINTRTTTPSDNSGNYGSLWTDYDSDGDLDLYISKCSLRATDASDPRRINQLFQNDGQGGFVDVAAAAGLADGSQSWTTDFGDIDNDGDLDCFIGNHMGPSRLMINAGNGTFREETTTRGVSVSWNVIQAVFRDFNNDGWLDLLLTGEEHGLWLNDRDGTFSKASNPFSANFIESTAVGDLNRDGFTDLYAGYARLYNTPRPERPDRLFTGEPNGNQFISITLLGRESNRLASGARIELYGPWGVQVREVRSGEGYGVTHSFSQIFGLGAEAKADRLVVRWPSGRIDTALNIAANQFLTLSEGDTAAPSLANPGEQNTFTNIQLTLPILAADSEGNTLTYSARNLPPGLTIDPSTGVISGTTAPIAGLFNPTVSVSDGWSQVSQSFLWRVQLPPDQRGLSFPLTRVALPGRIEAENYDTGGPGISYFDREDRNLGGSYRNDGVDIVASGDSDGTPAVSWIENGEWLSYSITVTPGNYDFVARVAAPLPAPSSIRIWLDERELGTIGVPRSATWQSWRDAILPAINIPGNGPRTLRLEFIGSALSLNRIDVLPSTNPALPSNLQRPFLGRALPIPGRIEAEYYDFGGAGIAYQDREESNLTGAFRNEGVDLEPSQDEDGSASLSFFADREWLEYTVSPRAGLYDITMRTAAGVDNPGRLRLTLNGELLALVQPLDSGSPQAWTDTVVRSIAIPTSGPQVLRIEALGNGVNLNWIDFHRIRSLPQTPADETLPAAELLSQAFGGNTANVRPTFPFIRSRSTQGARGDTLTFLLRLDSQRSNQGLTNGDFHYLPQASRDLVNWDLALEPVEVAPGLPSPPQGFKYASYRLVDQTTPQAFFRVDINPQ